MSEEEAYRRIVEAEKRGDPEELAQAWRDYRASE